MMLCNLIAQKYCLVYLHCASGYFKYTDKGGGGYIHIIILSKGRNSHVGFPQAHTAGRQTLFRYYTNYLQRQI